jgi:hypothetical protein
VSSDSKIYLALAALSIVVSGLVLGGALDFAKDSGPGPDWLVYVAVPLFAGLFIRELRRDRDRG